MPLTLQLLLVILYILKKLVVFRCLTDSDLESFGEVGRKFRHDNLVVDHQPVLLIPGLAGSCLEVKVDQTAQPPSSKCFKNHDWYQLWLAIGLLFPGEDVECFWYDLSINYFEENGTFGNQYGVHIRAMDFGGVKGVDYLDRDIFGNGIPQLAYFAPLIKDFEEAGFTVGKNLRAAPVRKVLSHFFEKRFLTWYFSTIGATLTTHLDTTTP